MPGPYHHSRMSSRPLQPHVERRHGLDRVLLDQRRERVHVVRLERLDVASEQVRVGPVDRARGIAQLEVARLERGPRPLERAVHGRDARVEQLRDLARLPAQHLAEDEDGALTGREVLERGDEREPRRLVRLRDHGRIGDRLHPGRLGQRVQALLDRLPRRAEIHRARTPLAAAEHVEADVRRDLVEPRAKLRTPLEAVDRAPGADERLLDRVLRLERRREHAVAVGRQLPSVLLELGLELLCGSRGLHVFQPSQRAPSRAARSRRTSRPARSSCRRP